jgi:hypothetical protein
MHFKWLSTAQWLTFTSLIKSTKQYQRKGCIHLHQSAKISTCLEEVLADD